MRGTPDLPDAAASPKPIRLETPLHRARELDLDVEIAGPGANDSGPIFDQELGSLTTSGAMETLRRRRDAGESLPGFGKGPTLVGARLIGADLAGFDLSGADLRGADLSGADLTGARLVAARLDGACLHGACLDAAELLNASIVGVDLSEATGERTGFGGADLSTAVALSATFTSATFTGANLGEADFRAAQLQGCRFLETTMDGAVFDGADLREADLSGSTVHETSFHNADLRMARLGGVTDYESADWVGVDVRHTDFCRAWLLRRHILDENYLAEFRSRSSYHEWIYKIWWLTSDCGRSATRWAGWTVLLCMIYGFAYRFVDLAGADHAVDTLYFSVVTFTTLGYGDVLPGSGAAKILVASEVVLGYMALGGMLSIISTKMGQRAGG